MFQKSRLGLALAMAGSAVAAANTVALERVAVPQPSPRNKRSRLNREQQGVVFQAAQDKRARRQARNLKNAGITQESTL